MNWTPDTALRRRMVRTLVLLVLVAGPLVLLPLAVIVAIFAGIYTMYVSGTWAISIPFQSMTGREVLFFVIIVLTIPMFYLKMLEKFVGGHFAEQRRTLLDRNLHYPSRSNAGELHRAVEYAAKQYGVPKPDVELAETDELRAYTLGVRSESTTVTLSTGLLRELDDAELRAVVAHELAHVRNRDVAVMTAVSMPVVLAEELSDEPLLGPVLSVVTAPLRLVGELLLADFSRAREFAADRAAAALTGDPSALASAFRKLDGATVDTPEDMRRHDAAFGIVSPYTDTSTVRWWNRRHLLATHPSLEERLSRLSELENELETGSPTEL
ncbi:M48 family metallopeptidase [Haloprofundus salinisoli]|uniref:M48 family metallopeptidase n=1 Tax=Haloprofundus salinisoli TaxID=2876193 RepID=UPI001CCAFD77|nr:M48 family metalloprotease [Haloprofundus salinisoli]